MGAATIRHLINWIKAKLLSFTQRIWGWFVPRKIKGLIVGCGSNCTHHSTQHLGRYSSSQDHPANDFLTVDPSPAADADYMTPVQDLLQNANFMKKYQNKLNCIIFENADPDIFDADPNTGHCLALDLAYEILAPNGICIVATGYTPANDFLTLAAISKFKYGADLESRAELKFLTNTLLFHKQLIDEPTMVYTFPTWMHKTMEYILQTNNVSLLAEPITLHKVKDIKKTRAIKDFMPFFSMATGRTTRSTVTIGDRNYRRVNHEFKRIPLQGITAADGNQLEMPQFIRPSINPHACVIKDAVASGKLKTNTII